MDALKYPDLFKPKFYFGDTDAWFYEYQDIPDELISNVNVIGYQENGKRWLTIRVEGGDYELTGGTREPNEPIIQTIQREMLEEAGAIVKNLIPVGIMKYHRHCQKPYRPYIPHPVFYRVIYTGEVEIVAKPTNPIDGEQVTDVLLLPLDDVMRRYRENDKAEFAELFQLASDILHDS